ncbi:MAG: helix-turn-helix transcriptional regulator [Pseudorhodobacter sp.]|nr:helix-turn-helix transcriptional regulator [Pseudorhodobacter sp.]
MDSDHTMNEHSADTEHGACQVVGEVLARVGDRWSVLAIFALGRGKMRFNELKREMNITQRMLSQTLRSLERDGLVLRRQFPCVPVRVEYELTALGESFADPVRALCDWARANKTVIETHRQSFVEPDPAELPVE